MRAFANSSDLHIVNCLQDGGVVVLPTDTLYGLVASIHNEEAVERVYVLRGRDADKPCIILVADVSQIPDTDHWTDAHWHIAHRYWPGKLSLVAPVGETTPEYLHRGTHTLAYRVPADANLRELLAATGPLIAPSANMQGHEPATTVGEARDYFSDQVDAYVEGGRRSDTTPSTVVTIKDGRPVVLRQGAVQIHEI